MACHCRFFRTSILLLMEYDQSVNSAHIQLVVHVFVRPRTLFLHLIRTFILSTTPEAVVVFRAQVLQNPIEAFHGLVTNSQSVPEEMRGGCAT
jgi:hypothetical protein